MHIVHILSTQISLLNSEWSYGQLYFVLVLIFEKTRSKNRLLNLLFLIYNPLVTERI